MQLAREDYQSRLLLSKLKLHKSIGDIFQKLMSDGMKINDCKLYISASEAKVVFRWGGKGIWFWFGQEYIIIYNNI